VAIVALSLRTRSSTPATLFPYTTLFRSRYRPGGGASSRSSPLAGTATPSRTRLPYDSWSLDVIGPWTVHAIRSPTASLGHGSYRDRKSTRLNSSHVKTSYAVFCLKKKQK